MWPALHYNTRELTCGNVAFATGKLHGDLDAHQRQEMRAGRVANEADLKRINAVSALSRAVAAGKCNARSAGAAYPRALALLYDVANSVNEVQAHGVHLAFWKQRVVGNDHLRAAAGLAQRRA